MSGVSHLPETPGYGVNHIDGTDPLYVGKSQISGRWLVLRCLVAVGSIEYANIFTDPTRTSYTLAWDNRASLNYVPYHQLHDI